MSNPILTMNFGPALPVSLPCQQQPVLICPPAVTTCAPISNNGVLPAPPIEEKRTLDGTFATASNAPNPSSVMSPPVGSTQNEIFIPKGARVIRNSAEIGPHTLGKVELLSPTDTSYEMPNILACRRVSDGDWEKLIFNVPNGQKYRIEIEIDGKKHVITSDATAVKSTAESSPTKQELLVALLTSNGFVESQTCTEVDRSKKVYARQIPVGSAENAVILFRIVDNEICLAVNPYVRDDHGYTFMPVEKVLKAGAVQYTKGTYEYTNRPNLGSVSWNGGSFPLKEVEAALDSSNLRLLNGGVERSLRAMQKR